eukprot:jgi/Tetstr1/445890/TSEL_003528.t1
MKVIAKKFRGVWHYGVITGVVTEWVLEDYGGATQWRAVFEDGDIVDLLRSEVVEAMAAAQEHPPVDADGEARLGGGGLDTAAAGAKGPRRPGPARRQGAAAGAARAKARRPGQRGAKARRPGQRGAKARRPGQRGAKARRPGQRGAKTAHTAESAERDALQAVDGSR